jgi:hypothetical protein
MKFNLPPEQIVEIWKNAPETAALCEIKILLRYYVKDFDKYGNQHLADIEPDKLCFERPKKIMRVNA